MNIAPRVSVVMPVYNAMPYLDESIGSILEQDFADFELVIRNDGSSDGSGECLRSWAKRDSRIRLFEGAQLGPAASSNWVVARARAPVIARMDADDYARRDRLDRQLAVLEGAKDALLVASLCEIINSAGRRIRRTELWRLASRSCFVPFPHTSIMMRKRFFEAVGGYRTPCDWWEDLDLFLRLAALGSVIVIPEPLVSRRLSLASTRLVSDRQRVEASVDRMYRCLALHARGQRYDHLLLIDLQRQAARKIDPRTFVSYGLQILWSGKRPKLFLRACRGALLRCNLHSMQCVVWTAWASLDPTSLRMFMLLLVRARNCWISHRISPHQLYNWQPFVAGRPRPLDQAASPAHAAVRPGVRYRAYARPL